MLCLCGAKVLSWCWREKKLREKTRALVSLDQTIIRKRKKIRIYARVPQDPCANLPSCTDTDIRSSVAPANPAGQPLILQHIYNLCNDNLIPSTDRGERTPPSMPAHASWSPTCPAFVSGSSCASAPPILSHLASDQLTDAPVPSAEIGGRCNVWSVAVVWPRLPRRPSLSESRGGVLKTSAVCQWYCSAGH